MLAIPTTTVTILRGTATNGYGDTVDSATVIATGVPASLVEQNSATTRPASRRPRTMRYARCRLPGTTPLAIGDRIKDEKTQTIWQLDDSTQLPNVATKTDLTLRLRRAT